MTAESTDAPGSSGCRSDAGPPPLIVRTIPLDELPGGARDLLSLAPDRAPLTWIRRGDGLVGWGTALRIDTRGPDRFSDADRAWRSALATATVHDEVRLPGTGPVAFGTFPFDDGPPEGGGTSRARGATGTLVVPRVVVGRRDGTAWLTTIDAPASSAAPAPGSRAPVTGPGPVTWEGGSTTPEAWTDAVADAVRRIRDGDLDQVVLARDVVARAANEIDPRWLLQRLAGAYDACWTFSVDGMVGATPELLVRSERGLVTSRVLAGTIPRADTDDATLLRAAQLARSSKDLEEHEYAVSSVARALAPFCSSMNVPDAPFVLHLPNVMHLASDVTGVLSPATRTPSSLALAAALHPSAAVCGTPTAAARELIRRIEAMDRGRYAGPVGWLGADGDGEWGIALRSAELDPDDSHRIRLFAGCGIVAASDPAAELAESEAKLEPLRYALGG